MYLGASVSGLDVLEPATFDAFGSTADKVRILVLRCEVDDLEWLHYKPQYVDTALHLTLYDGAPSMLAAAALRVLRRFAWRFHLNGECRIVGRSPHADRDGSGRPRLTREAAEICATVLGMSAEDLGVLADDGRIAAIDRLAADIHAHQSSSALDGSPAALSRQAKRRDAPTFVQEGFWPPEELPAPAPREASAIRRRSGTVLTPPELAIELARQVLDQVPAGATVRFADPAIGTGALFAALRHLAGPRRIERAVGYERNAERGQQTAFRWRRAKLEVAIGDFLRSDGDLTGAFSIVLANPPYLRYEMQDHEEAQESADRLWRKRGIRVPTRANLFVHFVLAAHDLMEPGAVAGWILPSEFLTATYARGLRRYLSSSVTLLSVHLYDTNERVFDNARISPAVVVFKNVAPQGGAHVKLSYGGTPTAPVRSSVVPLADLRETESWPSPARPEPPRGVRLRRLDEDFLIRRGLATGGNAFFVINDESRVMLGAPEAWIRPVLPKSRFVSEPVIRADDAGVPVNVPVSWLIDSRGSSHDIAQQFPAFAEYLESMPSRVRAGTIVRRRRYPFKQQGAVPPRFVFVAMARVGFAGDPRDRNERFFLNLSEAVALNNYHVLEPTGELASRLADGSIDHWEVLDRLRSIPESELMRVGRMHSAGLLKIEPSDLRSAKWSPTLESDVEI